MKMTDLQTTTSKPTPWHFWLIGIVGLLWSSVGAYDYIMTQTQNEAYMANFSAEQLEFFYGFPTWVTATWAIAIWGGVLGAVFLILRRRLAEPIFLVSLVAMILTTIHNYGLSNGLEVSGDAFSLVFTAVIFLSSIGLWWYAKAMRTNGTLK
jgi:hypothetical protein